MSEFSTSAPTLSRAPPRCGGKIMSAKANWPVWSTRKPVCSMYGRPNVIDWRYTASMCAPVLVAKPTPAENRRISASRNCTFGAVRRLGRRRLQIERHDHAGEVRSVLQCMLELEHQRAIERRSRSERVETLDQGRVVALQPFDLQGADAVGRSAVDFDDQRGRGASRRRPRRSTAQSSRPRNRAPSRRASAGSWRPPSRRCEMAPRPAGSSRDATRRRVRQTPAPPALRESGCRRVAHRGEATGLDQQAITRNLGRVRVSRSPVSRRLHLPEIHSPCRTVHACSRR